MEKGTSAERAGQVLMAAYPDARQREHAARWLGWVAYHMADRASFGAADINGWVPRRWLRLAGFLRALPELCCVAGAAYLVYHAVSRLPGSWRIPVLVLVCAAIAFALIYLDVHLRQLDLRRGGGASTWLAELALLLHRRIRLRPLLADAVDRGVLRRTGSAYTFADPAAAAALAAPYHARDAERARERAMLAARPGTRAAVIAFLTEGRKKRLAVDFGVGAAVLAIPFYPSLASPSYQPGGWLTIVGQFAALAAGMGACGAVIAWAALPLLRRLAGWSPRNVRLSRRELMFWVVVTLAAGALIFPALPRATPDAQGPNWTGMGLLVVALIWTEVGGALALFRRAFPELRFPLLVAAAAASALAFPVFPYAAHDLPDQWPLVVSGFALTADGSCVTEAALAFVALSLFRWLSGWSLRNVRLSRRGRLVALVAAAAAAGALVAAAGTGLAHAVAFTLPAVCVAACGLWLGILALNKTRGKARWLRLLPDAIGAVTTAAALLALTEHNLLTAAPATGLLFPVAIWGSIRVWLAMKGSDRIVSRAGADVTLSLLLGAVLVLFLVWLANLFGMSRPEIAAVRAAAEHVGAVADVPWWAWMMVYLVLAAVSLAIVFRPTRMANVRRWQRRLRVVGVTEAVKRTLTGVHIGLLMIVFTGAGASAALPAEFQHEIDVAYTVAFQRQLLARGELAAYTEIRQQLTASGQPGALTQVVMDIHHEDPPPPGDDDATSSEDDLARQVGVLQASTLALNNAQALALAKQAQTRARSTGLDAPVRDDADLTDRLTETSDQEQSSHQAQANAQQAGDLVMKVIASMINAANVGSNEVVQIVREYLSGLVEDSDVGDTLAERLPGVKQPAPAALAEPDPAKLEQAAQNELREAYKAAGNPDGFDDDSSYLDEGSVPPLESAVDMTNQSIQVAGGSCCSVPGEEEPAPEEGE